MRGGVDTLDSFQVQFKMSGHVVEADLAEMAKISLFNVRQELLEQPARFALVSTLLDLVAIKKDFIQSRINDMGSNCSQELKDKYEEALKHFLMLSKVQRAFSMRKSVLMDLLEHRGIKSQMLADYNNNLSLLWAFEDDDVRYSLKN